MKILEQMKKLGQMRRPGPLNILGQMKIAGIVNIVFGALMLISGLLGPGRWFDDDPPLKTTGFVFGIFGIGILVFCFVKQDREKNK